MKQGLFCLLLGAATILAAARPAVDPAQDNAPRPAIALPADFPKDVPLPKEAKPVEASKRPDGTRHLKLQTPGSMQDTTAFYAKQLPGAGWAITAQKTRGAAATFFADKDDRTMTIGIFDRGGFRQITIEADPAQK